MPATATRKRATTKRRKPASDTPQDVEWRKVLDTALNTPGSVGNVYSRFYSYSFLNCILLMMQGACEPVATYKRWLAMNRQVRKGEKALWIVRPIMVKKRDDNADPDADPAYYKRFKPVKCLFQVSQTDGEELPPVEYPEWDLDRALSALSINRMPYLSTDGNVQGHSRGRSFAINPVAVYPRKTALHEIAHIVLGHTADDKHGEYAAHRGAFEFEAEATAYLVLKELETITDAEATVSRGYIQGWLRDQQPTEPSIRAVFRAVNEILKAGRPAVSASAEGEEAA